MYPEVLYASSIPDEVSDGFPMESWRANEERTGGSLLRLIVVSK